MSEILEISFQEKAGIYAFLREVFATEPSRELLACLRTREILESLRSTGVNLEASDFADSKLPCLREDYTQLFIGPMKHISLNESVYTEKTPQLWGEAAVNIKELIAYVGLKLDERWGNMPDHISVEFELMQKLLEASVEAARKNDRQAELQCAQSIRYLHDNHIVKWVPRVCDQVLEKSQTNYFKAIGAWTKAFIRNF